MRAFTLTLIATAGLFVARPAHATDWVEVKTRHFTIYGKKSDKDLPKLAKKLEMLNKLLATVLKLDINDSEDERPLLVYVVSAGEVRENAGTNTVAGLYATDRRNGYALVTSGKSVGTFDLGQEAILFHEFAHHFMEARFNAAYPAWFVEGFAEFFATLKFEGDDKIVFGNPPMYRVPQLVMADLYPIHKLLHENSAGLSLDEGDRYYGAAWLLTHYFFLNGERGKEFQVYLTDMASPGGAKDVETYFKGGEKALDKELQAYVHSQLKAYRIPLSSDGMSPPQIRLLNPDENAMLIEEIRFKRPMKPEDARLLAKDVVATAAQFPDSAYAQAFLAEVLTDLGEWQQAQAAADAAIKIDPHNARAHTARAEILWGKAREAGGELPFKAILPEIGAANRADLNDPYPLFLYYQLKRQQGPLPEVAMDGLRKAYWQLPQYWNYRWSYAEAMAAQKDYQGAINVITPLANDPHGGKSAAVAQRRREEFMALRDGKPLPARDGKDKTSNENGKVAAAGPASGGKAK